MLLVVRLSTRATRPLTTTPLPFVLAPVFERIESLPSSLKPTPKPVTSILESRTLLVLASRWNPTVAVALPGQVMVCAPPDNTTLEAAISMHAPEIETKVRSLAIV